VTPTSWKRGKINEVIIGSAWRVRHQGIRAATGILDIVGAESEEEARGKVRSAYRGARTIVSVEKVDAG
jgi:hypothetical protein